MEEDKVADFGKITGFAQGLWAFRTFHTAVELEVFTRVENGLDTVEKISDDLDVEKEGIRRLLDACVSLGLLVKENLVYKNSAEAVEFLVKGKPRYYGDMVIMYGTKDSLKNLKKSIITGSPVLSGLTERMNDFNQAKIFTRAMHNNAIGPAVSLSKKFDFSKYKGLLDLGGGSGAYSIVLSREFQNLSVTLFDLPEVSDIARGFISEGGVSNSVNVLVGDFFRDEFPVGHDVVLLSQILHSWSIEENKVLLKKVYDSLPEGGVVIINEFLVDEDKTGPYFSALFSLNMLVQSEGGMSYTNNEVKVLLEDVGFEYLETMHLVGPVSSVIARK